MALEWSSAASSARDLIKGSRYTIYNGNERLIDESDEIYDFELKYSFYANCFGSSFRAVSEIMTLDDKMYRYTQQKDFPAESIDGIVSEFDFKIFDNHTAMLTWKTSKSLGDTLDEKLINLMKYENTRYESIGDNAISAFIKKISCIALGSKHKVWVVQSTSY